MTTDPADLDGLMSGAARIQTVDHQPRTHLDVLRRTGRNVCAKCGRGMAYLGSAQWTHSGTIAKGLR